MNNKNRRPLFTLGQTGATPGALELIERTATDVLIHSHDPDKPHA
ncbi:hypothetical protein [Paraburkholderia mimosarum]|nr:hypothetical protein [Paraburkholderia mimosarum]